MLVIEIEVLLLKSHCLFSTVSCLEQRLVMLDLCSKTLKLQVWAVLKIVI